MLSVNKKGVVTSWSRMRTCSETTCISLQKLSPKCVQKFVQTSSSAHDIAKTFLPSYTPVEHENAQPEGCGFTYNLWKSSKVFCLEPHIVPSWEAVGTIRQAKLSTQV